VPELIEVELYRKSAARAVGRTISSVTLPNLTYLKGTQGLDALQSATHNQNLNQVRRKGKLLILDIGDRSLGLRFGMTGRLVVDGKTPVERLLYTTPNVQQSHIRFVMTFSQGSELAMVDPRGFGNIELQPDETKLGPDAANISRQELGVSLKNSNATLKARLLNQQKISGLGNLLCDEILWRAGLDPRRPCRSLEERELDLLASSIKRTIKVLTQRGGSHVGDIQDQRRTTGICPKDGSELHRCSLGGRTTWWCPEHQR
jgi:formamidopyrimidine-DNA glycosylase